MKVLMSFFIMVSFFGCTTVRYTGAPSKMVKVDYPKLGVVTTANLGDPFVKKGDVLKVKVLSVDSLISTGGYYIPKGEYVQIGSDMVNDYFSKTDVRNVNGAPIESLAVKKGETGEMMVVANYGITSKYKADFRVFWKMSKSVNNFEQVLIYKGEVGSKIKIGYREFNNNRIRSAFSNDIEYDLKASKVIGYKGCKVEILEAGNVSLKYKLISNFK